MNVVRGVAPFSVRALTALGGEGINVFNRVIFGAGNTNLNAGTFGQVTNANDPRQVQVGLKLYW